MAASALLTNPTPEYVPGPEFVVDIPATARTLAGFRDWALSDDVPEHLRVSFIKGRIIAEMPKEDIQFHAKVKFEIATTLGQIVKALDFGDFFINGVLVTNEAADISNNPDMVAISWANLESGKTRYSKKKDREVEIVGSPDWILEIVSNSSVSKDKRDLRQAYHQAGIREYWLVDARGAEIEFRILHWRKAGYAAAPDVDGWLRSRVFEKQFRLTRKRDRRGGWQYQLAVKNV